MSEPYVAKHYAFRAQDYVSSTVHSQGSDLDRVESLVAGKELRRVLDIGAAEVTSPIGSPLMSEKLSPAM